MSAKPISSFRAEPRDPSAYPHDPRRPQNLPQTSGAHITVEVIEDEIYQGESASATTQPVASNLVIRPRRPGPAN